MTSNGLQKKWKRIGNPDTCNERIQLEHIGIEFGREKYAMLMMKSNKRHMMEEIEIPNQEKSEKNLRKGDLQVLGNIRSGHHQTSGDKRKN